MIHLVRLLGGWVDQKLHIVGRCLLLEPTSTYPWLDLELHEKLVTDVLPLFFKFPFMTYIITVVLTVSGMLWFISAAQQM